MNSTRQKKQNFILRIQDRIVKNEKFQKNGLNKIRPNIIKKMKSTEKQDYFIITSPEDELKEISLNNTISKVSYESPRLSKRSTEKFAIDSWDISQKLQPFQNQTARYKESFSTNFSPKINKSRYRAKSAFLTKDLESTNSHNFSSRKKCSLEVSTQRKTSLFFSKPLNSIQKAKLSISLSKQSIKQNKKTLKSKYTIERERKEQQQARNKTIQSYLIHQKQVINREKQTILSQRIGKEGIQFCVFPTEYWEGVNKSSPLGKGRKLKTNKNLFKEQKSKDDKKSTINSISPFKLMHSHREIQDSRQSSSTRSQSLIKRFQLFKDKLRKVLVH